MLRYLPFTGPNELRKSEKYISGMITILYGAEGCLEEEKLPSVAIVQQRLKDDGVVLGSSGFFEAGGKVEDIIVALFRYTEYNRVGWGADAELPTCENDGHPSFVRAMVLQEAVRS
jgi:hypothetical protein